MYFIRQRLNALSEDFYGVYCNDFPFEERKSLDKLNSMLKESNYRFFEVEDAQNGVRVAYFLVYASENMALVDYFAVDKAQRGGGIGTFALSLLKEHLNIPILLEIEPADNDENSFPSRRRRFYLRNGAIPVDRRYFLPTPDGKMQMELLYLTDNGTSEKSIDFSAMGEFLKKAISFIHSDIPHTQAVIDSYIGEFR